MRSFCRVSPRPASPESLFSGRCFLTFEVGRSHLAGLLLEMLRKPRRRGPWDLGHGFTLFVEWIRVCQPLPGLPAALSVLPSPLSSKSQAPAASS